MATAARRGSQFSQHRRHSASSLVSSFTSRRTSSVSTSEESRVTAFMATIPSWHEAYARIQMRIDHRGQPRAARLQLNDTTFLEVPGQIQAEFNPELPEDAFSAMKSLNNSQRLHNTRTFWGTLLWDEYLSKICVLEPQAVQGFQNDGGETAWSGPLNTSKLWPKGLDRCGNPITDRKTDKQARKTMDQLWQQSERLRRQAEKEERKQQKAQARSGARTASSGTSRVAAAA